MFVALLTVAGWACGQISPADMAELVSERLNRLDRIVLGMEATTWLLPSGREPEDRGAWYYFDGASPIVHRYRLTVVRPGVLVEWLTDLPDRGYVPADFSLSDGRVVTKPVRPSANGWMNYLIEEGTGHAAIFSWSPILQVIDVQIMDSMIPQWNLKRIFQQCNVTLVRGGDGISEYRASRDMGSFRQDYEFSLDDRGTPLRFKSINVFYSDPGLRPAIWEQRVMNTTDVEGVALPCEVLVTIDNQNLNLPYKSLHHFVITSVEQHPELTPEDVRIEPELRNSVIATRYADGREIRHIRDANGDIVHANETIVAIGPDPDGNWHISDLWNRNRERPGMIPVAVAVLSTCTFVMLTFGFFRRKSSRRSR